MGKNNGENLFLHFNGEKNGENGQNQQFSPLMEWGKGMGKIMNDGEKLRMKMGEIVVWIHSLSTNSTLVINNLKETSTTIFNNLNSLSTNSVLTINGHKKSNSRI